MQNLSSKEDVIREFSNRSGFNLQDSRDALDTFIEIFEDGCRDLVEINIPSLGKLKHTVIEAHSGNRPIPGSHTKEPMNIPESIRTTFVLSKQLKNLSKQSDE
jgi:nucleoid DNA-binding protein